MAAIYADSIFALLFSVYRDFGEAERHIEEVLPMAIDKRSMLFIIVVGFEVPENVFVEEISREFLRDGELNSRLLY